jgi:hypothetical protein
MVARLGTTSDEVLPSRLGSATFKYLGASSRHVAQEAMARFDHPSFQKFGIAELPLHRDIFMMDESYIDEWEAENIKRFQDDDDSDPYGVGYITPVHVSAITPAGLDLSWYPNTYDRFHEVKTFLPNEAFVAAALAYEYDKRVQLFVKSGWLRRLHLRANSLFAMIDAVDLTEAIRTGRISRERVIALRDRLDAVAAKHPDISFISFADSLLLKTNWTAGMVDSGVVYTYRPESLLALFRELQTLYRDTLGLEIYGVFAQGTNEFYDDPLLHISPSRNHVSLNNLGLPFAQISLIEAAARGAIRRGEHTRMEVYLDEDLFHSLQFTDWERKASWPSAPYKAKMTPEPGVYYYAMSDELMGALKLEN